MLTFKGGWSLHDPGTPHHPLCLSLPWFLEPRTRAPHQLFSSVRKCSLKMAKDDRGQELDRYNLFLVFLFVSVLEMKGGFKWGHLNSLFQIKVYLSPPTVGYFIRIPKGMGEGKAWRISWAESKRLTCGGASNPTSRPQKRVVISPR